MHVGKGREREVKGKVVVYTARAANVSRTREASFVAREICAGHAHPRTHLACDRYDLARAGCAYYVLLACDRPIRARDTMRTPDAPIAREMHAPASACELCTSLLSSRARQASPLVHVALRGAASWCDRHPRHTMKQHLLVRQQHLFFCCFC